MTTDTCSAWDPANCTGTEGCPPRWPRFIDKRGDPVLVEPYSSSRFDALVSTYVDYPHHHRSMGIQPATRARIEDWLERLFEPQFVVFADPAFHDRGIGSELCRHVIAAAADAGHEALVLDVDAANERAVHVYRRMGFETIERSGNDLRMRLSFDEPIVETVQLPPAERST